MLDIALLSSAEFKSYADQEYVISNLITQLRGTRCPWLPIYGKLSLQRKALFSSTHHQLGGTL